MKKFFTLMWLVLPVMAFAQGSSAVKGIVVDSATRSALSGATVVLLDNSSKPVEGAKCDSKGSFFVRGVSAGEFTMQVRYLGYNTYSRKVRVPANDTLNIGTVYLAQSSVNAADVVVEAAASRVEVKGDTLEYNASQFKTDKNAAAEDMIKKMPGIDISNGQVKAQGEQVKRVLVDGKPFFGDDPSATLKNLPSEVIDRVQVFDQMSDQSQFTRFDDGERNKTLNIVTRADRRSGQFGKLYAGYGTDDRYTAGGNVNIFAGDRRISVIGLSNNINQQNFSIQDILGAMGGGGGMMGRFAGNAMRMFGSNTGRGGMRMGGGGGGVSDFLVNQSDGITASNGLGINYTDAWSKDVNVTASYFVNYTDNQSIQNTYRQNFITESVTQLNNQSTNQETQNLNHRLNLRADYSIDSMSSLLFTPRFTWQSNDKDARTLGTTTQLDSLLNNNATSNINASSAYNISSDLLYRLRFATEGRTLSANFNVNALNNSGDQNTDAANTFFLNGIQIKDTVLQFVPNSGKNLTLGGNISYTEPLGKNHLLQLSYNINNTTSEADRRNYTNTPTAVDSLLNTALSNTSNSTYTTHKPGVSYRFTIEPEKDTTSKATQQSMMTMMFGSGGRPPGGGPGGGGGMGMGSVGAWVFNLGADYQIAQLDVQQKFPSAFSSSKTFNDILPNVSITHRPNLVSNLRFNYRTSTNQPSISQLQTVIDNSNPLQQSVGNSSLVQEYTHTFLANFGFFNPKNASGFFTMFNVNLTNNKIGSAVTVAQNDTTVTLSSNAQTVQLGRGAQITENQNVQGYVNGNYFIVYSFPWEPFDGLKLNCNTNVNVSYTRDPSLINGATNYAHTWISAPSLGISSNISENVDFTLSGATAINSVNNSIRSELNQTYYTHTIRTSATYIVKDSSEFLNGWLTTGDLTYTLNTGFASGFNVNVPLLNLGIGKRFLDGNAELKLSVFDILNQNNSITRNVGSGYVEDVQTNVLQRYFLLNFTYNLRNWAGTSK